VCDDDDLLSCFIAEQLDPDDCCRLGVTSVLPGEVPTRRRRHAITETPPVQAALNELRNELGTDRIELAELVVLGERAKLQDLRATRDQQADRRTRLADRVRSRRVGADLNAAESVRVSGWARR
jgi:hypothetical protein